MDRNKKKAAFEFMYKEFGKPIWWKPAALTRAGNPLANPPPPDLNIAEAESIFRLLATNDLIFPYLNDKNEPCFLLHTAKEKEWKEIIRPPNIFRRHWKKIGTFLFWSVSIIYSTYVGESVKNGTKQVNKEFHDWVTEYQNHSQTNAQKVSH